MKAMRVSDDSKLMTTTSGFFQRARQRGTVLQMKDWEGDDLRWTTKLRRRLQRRSTGDEGTPAKNTLISLNLLFFLYQTVTTVNYLRQRHPTYWPSHALSMIADSIVGSSVQGPLVRDFGFSTFLAQRQPHRYLTSGFLHGGIIHLLINMDTLRRQPAWLETGLGVPLYLTTFLLSIVAGNIGHSIGALNDDPFSPAAICLGSSGGICGMYGLLFASLIRMGNRGATSRIARGMLTIFLSGLFVENMSNMSHLGGFLCGIIMAILFSPSYKKSYSLRRKNSVEYDPAPRDFRQAMGFGIMPSERGLIPLPLLWGVLGILYALAKPKFRAMPAMVIKGLLFPGSVSAS